MPYSDDMLLTVAKELYLARVTPKSARQGVYTDEQHKAQREDVANSFCTFVNHLREKLKNGSQS